jgi:hypothetical protein
VFPSYPAVGSSLYTNVGSLSIPHTPGLNPTVFMILRALGYLLGPPPRKYVELKPVGWETTTNKKPKKVYIYYDLHRVDRMF